MVMTSMRLVLSVVLLAAAAAAQTVVDDPGKITGMSKSLDAHEGMPLRCEVTPIAPGLTFGLRLQAGYRFQIPMNQYSGPGHRWAVLTRITPEGGDYQPVYLASYLNLPAVPRTDNSAVVSGSYWVGEGRYSVRWMLLDDAGRVCRKDWRMDARLGSDERKIKLAIPPAAVWDLTHRAAPDTHSQTEGGRGLRLTVMMNGTLPESALSTLLDQVPAGSVRVVVYNLEQQKVLFREEGFTLEAIDRMVTAIREVELSEVDYQVLLKPKGYVDLLADLLNQEIRAPEPSDAVIFLGSRERYLDRIPPAVLDRPGQTAPRFFYLRYRPVPAFYRRAAPTPAPNSPVGARRGGISGDMGAITFPASFSDGPADIIEQAVKQLKGKTIPVHTPGEFAKALLEVQRQARR